MEQTLTVKGLRRLLSEKTRDNDMAVFFISPSGIVYPVYNLEIRKAEEGIFDYARDHNVLVLNCD